MPFITDHILSWVTFLPLAGALLSVDRRAPRRAGAVAGARRWPWPTSSLSLHLWFHFDPATGVDQFVEHAAWLADGRISYRLGMDGISLILVLLTTFLGPLVILSTWRAITERVAEFLGFLLLLQTAMIGTFVARDMLLFYVFWEAMLIPMYFIIGVWGGQRRIYAAVKFFIFTMVGSVFMLVGIIYLYFQAGSMDLAAFLALRPAAAGAAVAVRRVLPGLRHQGAAVPAAHLAAGRARRGADGRLGHPGRRAAEDGHLRHAALRHAAVPRAAWRRSRRRSACWRSSASSTARWWRWCSRT